MQEWISVVKELPPIDTLILCVGAKGGMFLGMAYRYASLNEAGTCYITVPNARGGRYVKYWMPLPKAPKDVE